MTCKATPYHSKMHEKEEKEKRKGKKNKTGISKVSTCPRSLLALSPRTL
jgi:hypothetical protein